uniref:Uncharacterized protein n=1 Tax=Spongospora subterranea TaxID=70186 RepID=A0A0H5QIR9_9EUKA|eukprot:CRZ01206.1 hypothetical protein [Spongospora subterranea]
MTTIRSPAPPIVSRQTSSDHVDNQDDNDPAISLLLHVIMAARASPSPAYLHEIRAQLDNLSGPILDRLAALALYPALPLLASDSDSDNHAALVYISSLITLCGSSVPLSFWPTCLGALSAASRRLRSESHRVTTIQLMRLLFQPDVLLQLSDSSFSKPLAHVVGALLESARLEALKTLRIQALNAVCDISRGISPVALTPIAPGLLSAIAGIAAADFKTGSGVIATALETLSVAMIAIIPHNASNLEFTNNAGNLVQTVVRRRLFEGPPPSPRVRISVISLASSLLLLPSLAISHKVLFDVLLSGAEDSLPAVSVPAIDALRTCSPLVNIADSVMHRLGCIAIARPHVLDVRAVTRAFRLCSQEELAQIWLMHQQRIMQIMLKLVTLDDNTTVALESRDSTWCAPFYHVNMANFPFSAEEALSLISGFVAAGSNEMSRDLLNLCLINSQPEHLVIAECAIKSSPSFTADLVLAFLDDTLWSNSVLRPFLLRCLAAAATRLGPNFQLLLMHALFPSVAALADSSVITQQSSRAALDRIALSQGHDSMGALLADNIDYLVDVIAFKLSSSASSLQTSCMLEKLLTLDVSSDSALAPLLIDTITTVVSCLDNALDDPALVISLLRVLLAAVNALSEHPVLSELKPMTLICDAAFYSGENIAKRLSEAEEAFRFDRRMQDSFKNVDDEEMVPPHDWGEQEINAGDAADDNIQDSASPDMEPELSLHFKTILLIVERTMHFIDTPDLHRRHVALELMGSCLWAIRNNEKVLLPKVALIWDPLKLGFSNANRSVLRKALDVADVIVQVCPSFIAHRVATELWPSLKSMMISEQRVLSSALNRSALNPSSITMQERALRLIRHCLSLPASSASVLPDIATQTSVYLSDSLPSVIQTEAVQLFTELMKIDPDLTWWTLTRLTMPTQRPPSSQCLPLHLQWQSPSSFAPASYHRNVAPLLKKLSALPEVRFDDYLSRL